MPKPKHPNFKGLGLRLAHNALGEKHDHPVRHIVADEGLLYIPIGLLRPNPNQPRQHFDEAALRDLTASVKEKGVLQPVIARKDPERDGYILIAGERRWRAATAAGLATLPALVRREEDALEVALIENLQRENLSAIEEAEALLHLKQARRFTDGQLAQVIGKSRQSVNDSLALNELPEGIKEECRTCGIGSKRQLLSIARAGAPEKVQVLWDAFRRGEITTVRAIQQRSKPAKGRGRHYSFSYRPEHGEFRLSVVFSRTMATNEEIRDAIQEALLSFPE
jgi:ParB family chromosome partitioning protein